MTENFNAKQAASDLFDLLRLRNTPIGIKMYERKEDMAEVPKLRRPEKALTICQFLAQAMQNGFTIGVTAENVAGENCRCISGLEEPTESFRNSTILKGGWFETEEDCVKHQQTLLTSGKRYEGLVASPLRAERIMPDACLITATPGQVFMLLGGLCRSDFKPIDLRFVGESSCSEGWVQTISTGKPGLVTPCYAELRFGNFSDSEMIVSLTPSDLIKAIDGMKALSAKGLRYPIPGFGITFSAKEAFNKTYKK